jgi:hypothetical protein
MGEIMSGVAIQNILKDFEAHRAEIEALDNVGKAELVESIIGFYDGMINCITPEDERGLRSLAEVIPDELIIRLWSLMKKTSECTRDHAITVHKVLGKHILRIYQP